MSSRDPMVSVEDIRVNLELIMDFTRDTSFQDFQADIRNQYAVIRCFEVIGEAARRVPDDFRARHPEFPWKAMSGMRDKLIHGYDTVDPSILWGTIRKDVPEALSLIGRIPGDS